jgi:phosphomannomutase
MQASRAIENYQFHPSVLRAYDIRGIVGETLHEEDAYVIGRAFATFVINKSGKQNPDIALGKDGRESSPILSAALAEGIKDAGGNVKHVEVGPTPMLYFTVRHLKLDAGIMVTGSHNPPTHNGFKMMLAKEALFGDQILSLGDLAANNDLAEGQGSIEDVDIKATYIKALIDAYDTDTAKKELTVCWDPGNGAAGEVADAVCTQLAGNHTIFNEVIDGTFPAHHPDPTVAENLQQLIDSVKEKGADVGVAFDGDGDRLGVVDSKGRIVWGDQLMVLLARDVLEAYPGSVVIADVKASKVLFDEIAKAGGKPQMWKTGHSLVKAKMAEMDSKLAGEMSGHIFFADRYYGFDDGVYAAVRLLNYLARSEETLEQMIDALPKTHSTPELRIACDDARKFDVITEVQARLKEEGADVSTIDGARVDAPEGWWLLRASNTQAALVARCESETEEGLQKLSAILKEQLEKSGVKLEL